MQTFQPSPYTFTGLYDVPQTYSGAALKLVQVNSTPNGLQFSSATFPSSAGATGTVLRSDGTNWLASTATYPDTVTANRLLYATGTNAIGSSANFTYDGITLTSSTATTAASGTNQGVNTVFTANASGTTSANTSYSGLNFIAQTGIDSINHASSTLFGARGSVIHQGSSTLGAAYGSYPGILNTGAGTITTAIGYGLLITNSGGGTITALSAFQAPASTAPGTYRGFEGQIASGTNKHNLYINGTAQNWLAGFTGVGDKAAAATPATYLNLSTSLKGAPSLTGHAFANFISDSDITTRLQIGHASGSPFGVWFQVTRTTDDGTSWPLVLNPLGGRVSIGLSTNTALLNLAAGTATASTAPLKFTSGTLNTTAEAGAVEFLTDDYYATITTGAARKTFVLTDGTVMTSSFIPVATTNGRLRNSNAITHDVSSGITTFGTATTASPTAFIRTIYSNTIHLSSEGTGASGSAAGAFMALYSNDGAAMASGDRLGGFLIGGSSSASAIRNSTLIAGFATENWVDASAYGSRFDFELTPNLSTTRAAKMRLLGSGRLYIGAGVDPTATLHLAAGTASASTAPLKFTSGTSNTTPEAGAIEYDGNKLWVTNTSLARESLVGALFTQTADASVTNTLTETSIVGAGVGYGLTLPANFWVAGKTIRVTMSGVYSTVAVTGDTVTIKIKYGSTVLTSKATSSLLTGATNLFWSAEVLVTCRTVGATGTVQVSGGVIYQVAGSATVEDALNNGVATTTLDTTASGLFDVTVTHSAADASNTVKSLVSSFEVLN